MNSIALINCRYKHTLLNGIGERLGVNCRFWKRFTSLSQLKFTFQPSVGLPNQTGSLSQLKT